MIWRPVRALVLPNGQHACGVQALFEQEVTEGTEKGYSLCLLCFLLFKIRMFWLRLKAALGDNRPIPATVTPMNRLPGTANRRRARSRPIRCHPTQTQGSLA